MTMTFDKTLEGAMGSILKMDRSQAPSSKIIYQSCAEDDARIIDLPTTGQNEIDAMLVFSAYKGILTTMPVKLSIIMILPTENYGVVPFHLHMDKSTANKITKLEKAKKVYDDVIDFYPYDDKKNQFGDWFNIFFGDLN